MAAFLQKLFKSRKTATTDNRKAPRSPEPAAPATAEPDHRELLREQQEQQLSGKPEQAELAILAIEGATAAIRLKAARELRDEQHLQQVQKNAKGRDKVVFQTVKQALQELREHEASKQATRQRIDELVRQAEDQARSEDTKLFEARLKVLQENWQQVDSAADATQTQRFLQAIHDCTGKLQQLEAAQIEEQRHRDQKQQRQDTLALLQQTLEQLKATGVASQPSEPSLDALQKTQENRWLEATRDTTVEKQEQKEYEQAMLSLRSLLAAVRRLNHSLPDIQAQLGETGTGAQPPGPEAAKSLLDEISWPKEYPAPESLQQLARHAGKPAKASKPAEDRADQQQKLKTLTDSLDKLEASLGAQLFKESRQLLKLCQQQFQELDERSRRPLRARMQLLSGQFRELSDWQGFATEPKQVALCEQMEYLADQHMEPEAKAERIRELQADWRELGGSSDRTLWNRFKAASDIAYEPCKAYFEAKSDLKQVNLQQRETICNELALYLDQADWQNADWKAAERIHQTARQEWKAAWPVDFRNNRKVQKRFDDLLKRLEQPLDAERKKNEDAKQAIVDRALELVAHEPLQEAMEQAKALQTEWKQIGITRHREDRKLWQAFRKACDQIFARRDAQRSAQKSATEQADQHAREIMAGLSDLDTDHTEESLAEAKNTLQTLSDTALSKAMREQLHQLRRQLDAKVRIKRLEKKLDSWKNLINQRVATAVPSEQAPQSWQSMVNSDVAIPGRDLAIRAEILAGTESPEADQARRMEIQVQRLTDGMGSSEHQSAEQELEKLIAHWCLHPDDEGRNRENANRLAAALQASISRQ